MVSLIYWSLPCPSSRCIIGTSLKFKKSAASTADGSTDRDELYTKANIGNVFVFCFKVNTTVCGLTLIIPTQDLKNSFCSAMTAKLDNKKKKNASKFSLNMKIAAINNLNG